MFKRTKFAQEDTEEEPDTPHGSRSPTRSAAASALTRAFSSGPMGRAASLDQPGTPTISARGLSTSGVLVLQACCHEGFT